MKTKVDLLFIFHDPFLKANLDFVDVACFHIIRKAEVNEVNKFHEVRIVLRFCKTVAENNWGDVHNPERPCLCCHMRTLLVKVWHPCPKL